MLIRVGTYNLHNCDKGLNLDIIANEIKEHNLDIVGLQEIDQFTNRAGNMDMIKLLAEKSGMPHYVFSSTMPYDGGEYGHGILSKHKIIEHEKYFYETGKTEPRVLARHQLILGDTRLFFFNTHLSLKKDLRADQLSFAGCMMMCFGPHILVGDFNVGSFSEYENLECTVNHVNHPHNPYETFKTGGAIDNIITSPDISIIKSYMVDTKASDHNLIVAELNLPEDTGFNFRY